MLSFCGIKANTCVQYTCQNTRSIQLLLFCWLQFGTILEKPPGFSGIAPSLYSSIYLWLSFPNASMLTSQTQQGGWSCINKEVINFSE